MLQHKITKVGYIMQHYKHLCPEIAVLHFSSIWITATLASPLFYSTKTKSVSDDSKLTELGATAKSPQRKLRLTVGKPGTQLIP